MSLANGWTGQTASALQAALRLSHEAFAEHLGVSARTVAAWHQKPDLRPKSEMQQLLDTAHDRAPADVKTRFAILANEAPVQLPEGAAEDAEVRLSADPNMVAALDWLDHHTGWEPGTARRNVAMRLAHLNVNDLHDRGIRRGRVNQRDVAQALTNYYGTATNGHGTYTARFGSDVEAATSVLTHPIGSTSTALWRRPTTAYVSPAPPRTTPSRWTRRPQAWPLNAWPKCSRSASASRICRSTDSSTSPSASTPSAAR